MSTALALPILLAMIFGLSALCRMAWRAMQRRVDPKTLENLTDPQRFALLACREVALALAVLAAVYGLGLFVSLSCA